MGRAEVDADAWFNEYKGDYRGQRMSGKFKCNSKTILGISSFGYAHSLFILYYFICLVTIFTCTCAENLVAYFWKRRTKSQLQDFVEVKVISFEGYDDEMTNCEKNNQYWKNCSSLPQIVLHFRNKKSSSVS